MPNLHKLFSVVFFGLFSVLIAQSTTSITNGNWTDSDTWNNGVPGLSKDAIINHVVTIQASEDVFVRDLTINGTLNASATFATIGVKGDWTNTGTYNTSTTSIVTFNSTTADQTVKPGGDSFPDLVLKNTGFSINIYDNIDIDGDLTLTTGTLDLNTRNQNVNVSGDVEIALNAVWTSGSGTVTFDGGAQTFTDNNGSATNIGDIVVD
tara:strand:+ start:28 stop:651 length:624 start_codon:yes stop_codon:yes gene_type:complete